ncbi:hypothetical protein ACFVZT_45840, partial [Streptomyces sp. NPDC058321]|uniref:hypothetical protein n=1 Tax=Streptomyces sp. NPDC058321 TaxID=3346445 RepID=UPI0036E242C8
MVAPDGGWKCRHTLPHAGGDPHACNHPRRPRSCLPPLRLPRHSPSPARCALSTSGHGQRSRLPSQDSAETALLRFLDGEAGGFDADPNQTVTDYLNAWLTAKAMVLKPTTMARYRDYVR